jgi:hypothetical protein
MRKKIVFSAIEDFHFFESGSRRNQKKALAAPFVVGLIIIIISLGVLVLIFSGMFNSDSAQRDACKTSALVKATLPDIAGTDLKGKVFLNCKARRICITSKLIGEDCAIFGKDYEKMRISGTDAERTEKIKMIVAREMADCWNMLGEGNLQIFRQELVTTEYSTRAIVCSRFYFDSSITETLKSVSGINDYMLTHKAPGQDKSYWDYLRNTPDGETISLMYEDMNVDLDDSMDLTQQKAIIYLESDASKMGYYIGAGAGFIVGNFMLYGVGGGLLGKGLGAVGKTVQSVGGKWAYTALYAGVEGSFLSFGGEFGDWVQSKFSAMGDAKAVSAIIVTDYSDKLNTFGISSFENIA